MLILEDLRPRARVNGLDPACSVEIISVSAFGPDAVNVVFRANAKICERLVYREEAAALTLLTKGTTFSFEADGGHLKLASEALRIRLAHLFDPYLAVNASQIEALPHQLTAVYGEMLPRQPLRFLLADDPGAGKTVMAGLLIKELLIRGDLERCLIVAPGSLVEQWQDELSEKFGLTFDILSRDQINNSASGNPFAETPRLIARLDMLARSDELQAKLEAAQEWDLVICDEAHRMSASFFGNEIQETRRHKLGKRLGSKTRNLLLMSATPHNGKEADFQLFMGLLDADRFEGRFREGVHKADVSDMMRRLTKEELYRFDGTPLFPERRAYTASYELSHAEVDLYQAVTTYVREEMNKADRGEEALRDLLIEAVRYGDRPEKKAELFRKVEGAVDVHAIETLVAQRKLTSEGMNSSTVQHVREEMERAQARRLQPHFIGSFFREAFDKLGGRLSLREAGRYEISRVPSSLKERDRLIGRTDPVLDRYARVTFDKQGIPGTPQAELIAPGHPLLDSVVDLVLELFGPTLHQGSVLIDESDLGDVPKLLVYFEHAIRDGRTTRTGEPRVVSQRLQFVFMDETGKATDGGSAPYLEARPSTEEEKQLLRTVLSAPWLSGDVQSDALRHAIQHLVPTHLDEVRGRRIAEIDKVDREVRARLNREINYWDARAARLREEERAGKTQRINAQNAEATAAKLVERLHRRQAELDRERLISALPPILRGVALIVPAGLLNRLRPAEDASAKPDGFSEDPLARAAIELAAMDAVLSAERNLGHSPIDVSAEKKGWDIESRHGITGALRFIEVKGRHVDGRDVIVTKNELLASLNAPDAFVLALVQIEAGFAREPVYVRQFFEGELGFAQTAAMFNIQNLMTRGTPPS